jgi:hypothetical protein
MGLTHTGLGIGWYCFSYDSLNIKFYDTEEQLLHLHFIDKYQILTEIMSKRTDWPSSCKNITYESTDRKIIVLSCSHELFMSHF